MMNISVTPAPSAARDRSRLYKGNTPRIGMVELPEVGLVDQDKNNWIAVRKKQPLISKQVLLANLQGEGFDAQLVDLRDGDHEETYDEVMWCGKTLSKTYLGQNIHKIDPQSFDAWGVTNNFGQQREVACLVVKHLASQGRPVIVGGSDAIAEPTAYFEAGASLIVKDKTGAVNSLAFDHVLGNAAEDELMGVILPNGTEPKGWFKRMSPEDWSLPSLDVVRQCMGQQYWREPFPAELKPIGSVFTDIGCDRKCDFCQTPQYKIGYQAMSPETVFKWVNAQKEAGAKSIILPADQFLGRMIFDDGRETVLEIMEGIRKIGLPFMYPNGVELRKMTLGRGFNKSDTDLTPDVELIEAVLGWDGSMGAFHLFAPAERPVIGRENYAKLLPWQEHVELMKAVVRSGVPAMAYGLIIGFDDESEESLISLEEAVQGLYDTLREINPELDFRVAPYSIFPIPGTPQGKNLIQSELLKYTDPMLMATFSTVCADSNHLTHKEIADWQFRLGKIGKKDSKLMSSTGLVTY